MSRPARRYSIRLGASMTLYVISLFVAVYLVEHRHVAGPVLWPLALLPAVGIVGAFYAVGMLREAVASYREAAREAGVERYFGIWRERGESGE